MIADIVLTLQMPYKWADGLIHLSRDEFLKKCESGPVRLRRCSMENDLTRDNEEVMESDDESTSRYSEFSLVWLD